MPAIKNFQDWAVLPYNSKKIDGHYLVTNALGSWAFLTASEFKRLEQLGFDDEDEMFEKLQREGLVVKEDNVSKLVSEYRNLQAHIFNDTSLHIAVVTTRCNIACTYCHADKVQEKDMNEEVALRILKYCFDVRNPNINLEFQGGEPLLNWKIIKFLTENIRKFNTTKKNIYISLVTNGILLSKEKIEFFLDHDVDICISLDGPEHVHNQNRVFHKGGGGSYEHVARAIKRLQDVYKSRNVDKSVNLLPTISRQSLPFAKEIIDEYVKWGASVIAIRRLNKLGAADDHWEDIGYAPEQFNVFWAEAMDYILKLNKEGVRIKERMATVILHKILKKQDPGYVDLSSPCGAGRSVLTYMPSGDIYPCDESRMVGDDFFKLGSVLTDSYETILKHPKVFSMCQSSLVDLWDYKTTYSPWIGTCPVMNYTTQGNMIPKITQTPMHKVMHFRFDYIFTKMLEDKQNQEIFYKWAG